MLFSNVTISNRLFCDIAILSMSLDFHGLANYSKKKDEKDDLAFFTKGLKDYSVSRGLY